MLSRKACEEKRGSVAVAMTFEQEQKPAQNTELVIGMVALTL
jgi:hypothetical protein